MAKQTAKDPFASIATPMANTAQSRESEDPFASIATPFKKKVDTALSGKTSSTAGKSNLPESNSAWYDWENIKKAGSNLIDFGQGLAQEIPSETTRLIGDTISALGLTVDLGGRYSSAAINYLSGDKKQAQKDIDSDPTFLGKYLIDAGQYLSESADQTKESTLKNWGVSDKNRNPQRSFYDAFSDGELGDGAAMLFRDVLATAPQVAAAVLTGGGSLEAQALRTSSGLLKQSALAEMGSIASSELPSILSAGMKSQTGGQFKFGIGLGTSSSLVEEYKKDNNITATDFIESLARGVIEGASETLFDSDIIAAKQLASKFVNISDSPISKGIMSTILSEGEDEAREKIVRTTGDVLRKTFAGGRNEGFEEVASSFGNMLIDATKAGGFTLDSFDKFKKDATESFIVGALSGGAISGGVAKYSRVRLTDEQEKTIERYNEIASDTTISDDARGIAKKRIQEILDYNADLSKENYRLVAALPKEKRTEALDYLFKINQLEDDKRSAKDLAPDIEETIKSYEEKVNNIIDEEYKFQVESRRKESMSQSDIDTESIVNLFQSIGSQGISIEDMDSAINEVRNKVNNNEEINQDEVDSASNVLYDILDEIEKSELTPEQKKIASEPFFNQIEQLDSYEKTIKSTEVITPIEEVTRTTRETGRIERPKTTVTTDRFNLEPVEVFDSEGNKSSYVARVDENGSLSLVPKVKFSRVATEQKRKTLELDSNLLQFQESIKDENDRVIGAKLLDRKTGNVLEISNPELAIDLATRAKQETVGNVSEGIMEQDVTVKPIGELTSVVKEFVNKRAETQAPVSEIQAEENLIEEPVLTTEMPSSPVGLPSRKAYVVGLDILNKTGNKILNKVSPEMKSRISNYTKAIKASLPELNVVLYDNKQDMIQGLVNQGHSLEKATKAVNESKGLFSQVGNTIHIDVTRMDKETLAHEVFHPLVVKLANENPAEFTEMRQRISKVLSGSDLAALNRFAKLYAEEGADVSAEEFLAQLAGLVTTNKVKFKRGEIQKIAMAIKEFIKKVASKINSKSLSDFADSLFTEKSKTEDLIKFFEGYGRSLRQGTEIDTTVISDALGLGESEAYSDSIVLNVSPESISSEPTIKASKIGQYEFPEGAVFESVELPAVTLKEIVEKYNGRVIIITSDATGYGVDSLGEPILGGFGFSAIKNNIDDNIGFASVGEGAVKSTMSRALKIHGKGKAAVLVMIQPAFTTIGNSYGVKYFARGMRDIAKSTPDKLSGLKEAMKATILSSKTISSELKREDSKTGKRNTEAALFKLIDSINENTDINEFTKEFLKDTTFTSRTGIINTFLIDSTDVGSNKAAHPLKVALKDLGYSKVDFLKEYGDKSFLTDKMIESNAGGFVVGGFEVDLKDAKTMAKEIAELQGKGIEHPLFNGKMGGTNHFVLDGIYGVNENFASFAVPESNIEMDNDSRDALVRENYKDDKFYNSKGLKLPLEKRTYTELKTPFKIEFKESIVKPLGKLSYKKANVASSVARSLGFNLDEQKRDDLRSAEFKKSNRDKLRQQKKYPDALAESRKEYADKNKNTIGEISRYVRKLLFERNINIKKAMQDAELEFSLYTMYNKAGASMFGNLKFTEEFNKIYGDLSAEEIKLLDNFVFLRRVVAIDTNFDNRGVERPKHSAHNNIDGAKTVTTKETALATLEDYKDFLGDTLYEKIYNASDNYFKAFSNILKYKYDNGLINRETYELYKDYNYSPRKFLKFVFGTSIGEEALSPNNFYQRGLALSKQELKNIENGSDEGILVDSAKLLHAAMIATEVRVASNLALKTLYQEAIPRNLDFVKEVEYETNPDKTLKINEDGSLKYKKEADKGFRIVTFKEDGVITAFQLREDLAKEYFDEELFDKNSKAYKIAQLATGANILRNMATGMNIAFPFTNIPVDVISQVQLNNIYDGASVGVAGQYAKSLSGTISNSFKLIPYEFGKENAELENLIYEYGKAGGLMMSMSQEYAAKDKFFGAIGKYLGAFGNASEMASKLTAYKTVKEREIAEFKDKNGSLPTGEDMVKIQTKAAYIARAAMDYHRGGLLTKWIDGFVPYLNVLSQGTKITVDYMRNNPTAFLNKILQAGLYVTAITIYNMSVAGSDYDNDDNEQDLATKIVIFNPFKNADGTRGKIEIGVPAPIKSFLNIFQNMGEGIYYNLLSDDKARYDQWKSTVNAKFLDMFSSHLATNIPPALKALIEYNYNLDLWRGGKVAEKMGQILPEDEGRYDKNVAEFYKIIGSSLGASPKRLQKASENFITQSNPLVGAGYAMVDKMINNFQSLPESQRSKFDNGNISDIPVAFLDKISGRIYSVTDPKVTYKKGADVIERINQEAGSKKQEVKAEMRSLIEKNASVKEMNDYLIKQDPIYRRSAKDYAVMIQKEKMLKYPNNKDEYYDIMLGANAEAKAQIIYAYFPHLLMEGNENLRQDLSMLKLFSGDIKVYFNKYHKNKGIPK